MRRCLPLLTLLLGCPGPPPCEDAGEWLREPAPIEPGPGDAFAGTRPADGNRAVAGAFDFSEAAGVDAFVTGAPRWVAAVPWGDDSLWVAVFDDRPAEAFVVGDAIEATELDRYPRNPAAPPSLAAVGGNAMLLDLGDRDASTMAPATPVGAGRFSWVRCPGELVLDDAGEAVATWDVGVLPDARVAARDGLMAAFGDATRFEREALGDDLEGSTLDLFDPVAAEPVARVEVDEGVLEGLGPLLVDLDDDGVPEVLAPGSARDDGAVIGAWKRDGTAFAESEAAPGAAWRQLIAAGPFGDDGLEIASVRSPQQGGPVQFHRWDGSSLVRVAEGPAIASHQPGSRNLDRVVAIDVDGDGGPELLGPGVGGLVVLDRQAAGVLEAGAWPLDGSLSTNVFAGVDGSGRPVVGAGTADGRVRVWRGRVPRVD